MPRSKGPEGEFRLLLSPSPSWPLSLKPQHFTESFDSITHEWNEPPRDTIFAVSPDPRFTDNGMFVEATFPSPNCPRPLEPQHLTEESTKIMQVWSCPQEMLWELDTVTNVKRKTNPTNPSIDCRVPGHGDRACRVPHHVMPILW